MRHKRYYWKELWWRMRPWERRRRMRRLLRVMESERMVVPPHLRDLVNVAGPFSLLPHEWKRLSMMLVVLLLTGCMTTYEVVKQTPEGDVRVIVKSFREFEQPQIHYSRQGEDVVFDFGAESATTAVSPVEEAFGEAIKSGAVLLRPVGQE